MYNRGTHIEENRMQTFIVEYRYIDENGCKSEPLYSHFQADDASHAADQFLDEMQVEFEHGANVVMEILPPSA